MKNIPYGHQWITAADATGVLKTLRSGWLTQGPKVAEFEEELRRYAGCRYCVAVSSGTAALHLGMLALRITRGDKVITSPVTFSATANCAVYVGARPDFVDIDDLTYHMDIMKLTEYLKSTSRRKRVKAVIPVHFMGTVSDIPAIKSICDKYGISIVEDAAHALGASYKEDSSWLRVGSCRHSDITVFSFHPIKHITTGEGGALLTNDKKVYRAAIRLRHHGIAKSARGQAWRYDIEQPGFNYRLTDFQCALGISQLKRISTMVQRRRRLVENYNRAFKDIPEIRIPYERPGTRASYHLYVIRVPAPKRNMLYEFLKKKGISTQVNYIPVHFFSWYRKTLGFRHGDFPVAEQYFKECLSLPLFPTLPFKIQHIIIQSIQRFFSAMV